MRKGRLFLIIALLVLSVAFFFSSTPSNAQTYPAWAPNTSYATGTLVTYQDASHPNHLYKCLQAHTSLTGWEPPNVPALWQDMGPVGGGATATRTTVPATNTPTLVRTNTPTAVRTNTPTAVRTNTPVPPTATSSGSTPAWAPNVSYAIGTLVTYQDATHPNHLYKCIQAHTSLVGWEPPNAAALWQDMGPVGGNTPVPTFQPPTNTPGGPTATQIPVNGHMFAPYIDVSPGSTSPIMQLASNGSGNKFYSLAFILGRGCSASWFGTFTLDTAEAAGIGTRINELRAAGGDVIVSFGGAAAPELANVCSDVASLQAQYQAVVTKYNLKYVDFDIEDFSTTAIDLRNKALKGLEAANPGLQVHYTLGVLESGFTSSQNAVLTNAKSNGTRVDLVNIMAMDYGHAVSDMYAAAVSGAQNARSQLNSMGFTSTQLGITPMIGVNDSAGETFTLANASSLVSWSKSNNIALLAFWSVGRDNGGCPGGGAASASCSGVSQNTWDFSHIFQGF